MNCRYQITPSPFGEILIAASDAGICRLDFIDQRQDLNVGQTWIEGVHPDIRECSEQLTAYFSGDLTAFKLPLAATGTDFQKIVWAALCDIPYGTTCSYAELASSIDRPTASRAVGAANGKNPIAIVVPCHRVIGANGTLTGYAGGIARKQKLLELESRQLTLS
ncbi:MAG: methylated-DNA-[protein]-cysteine S-methyltransferase [Halieaceae bacterium]|jgi:methylated-DNA-[protein]-cysteine S-methyltransferase